MLEKDTRCWICRRTEEETIKELGGEVCSKELFDEIYKGIPKDAEATEKGMLYLENVGMGYSYAICAICRELIYWIGDKAANDRINYEEENDHSREGTRIIYGRR